MARSFNGTSDLITMGSPSVLYTAALSISCWIYPTAFPGVGNYSAILSAQRSGGNSGHSIYLSNNKMAVYVAATGSVNFDPGSHTFSTNTWYHVAYAYDSTNGLVGYVNGASDGTAAANGALLTTLVGTVDLGQDPNFGPRFFSGWMADAAQWNTNLSAGEISALANGARPNTIRPANLAGYWPLTGLQSPEPDLSSNANNGTLTGTTNASGPPVMQLTPRWPQRAAEAVVTIPELQNFNAFMGRRIAVIGY